LYEVPVWALLKEHMVNCKKGLPALSLERLLLDLPDEENPQAISAVPQELLAPMVLARLQANSLLEGSQALNVLEQRAVLVKAAGSLKDIDRSWLVEEEWTANMEDVVTTAVERKVLALLPTQTQGTSLQELISTIQELRDSSWGKKMPAAQRSFMGAVVETLANIARGVPPDEAALCRQGWWAQFYAQVPFCIRFAQNELGEGAPRVPMCGVPALNWLVARLHKNLVESGSSPSLSELDSIAGYRWLLTDDSSSKFQALSSGALV
jgi:hypothetical protein